MRYSGLASLLLLLLAGCATPPARTWQATRFAWLASTYVQQPAHPSTLQLCPLACNKGATYLGAVGRTLRKSGCSSR